MSTRLELHHGIKVSRNAIDKRFNASCEEFIKSVLGEVLRERYSEWLKAYGCGIFSAFNRVRIKDSTKFQIPDSLKDEFPGMGGCASKAGVSIQFEYDIKSGEILYMEIGKGSANDHEDLEVACLDIQAGDLLIRDLGYFSHEVFRRLSERKACFLSRLDNHSVVVIEKTGEKLSFEKLYRRMQKQGLSQTQVTVLIGSRKQLKVRLMLQVVPEQVYEQRMRNYHKRNACNARIKNRKSDSKDPPQIRSETKARYHFTLLITNIPDKDLPLEKALPLYRIRWQVELLFKGWKGVYNVDKTSRMKKERFLCILLAKLLLIAIQLQLIFRLQATITNSAPKNAGEKMKFPILSPQKVLKTLHGLLPDFMQMIRGKQKIPWYIGIVQQILSRNHTLERRKNKLSFPEILELFCCIIEK